MISYNFKVCGDMKDLDYSMVGKRIKEKRKQKHYSQYKLADITGLSSKYISEIELGKKEGRLDIYVRIAEALNVSLDEFVADSVSADSVIFENKFNVLYKSFGKTRKEMLLNYMDFLYGKQEYDNKENED